MYSRFGRLKMQPVLIITKAAQQKRSGFQRKTGTGPETPFRNTKPILQ